MLSFNSWLEWAYRPLPTSKGLGLSNPRSASALIVWNSPVHIITERMVVAVFEEMDDILTPEDACAIMKVGKNRLYELLSTNQLKAYRNGRVWRIPKRAVVEYICKAANLTSQKLK